MTNFEPQKLRPKIPDSKIRTYTSNVTPPQELNYIHPVACIPQFPQPQNRQHSPPRSPSKLPKLYYPSPAHSSPIQQLSRHFVENCAFFRKLSHAACFTVPKKQHRRRISIAEEYRPEPLKPCLRHNRGAKTRDLWLSMTQVTRMGAW
jgi:hypothetical protein